MLVMIDLDNTLGNRSAVVRAWISQFVGEHDLPLEAKDAFLRLDNDGYSNRNDVFAAFRDEWDLAGSVEQLVAQYQDQVIELAAPTVGAFECLADLRNQGLSIAIVTNGSTKQQHGKIDTIGLRPLVDAVIVSGDLGIKKPDARIYEAAAAATGQDLATAWMVGDSAVHDVVGAQAFGAKTAWIHRDREWPTEHQPPTVILDDLRGLAEAIRAHR